MGSNPILSANSHGRIRPDSREAVSKSSNRAKGFVRRARRIGSRDARGQSRDRLERLASGQFSDFNVVAQAIVIRQESDLDRRWVRALVSWLMKVENRQCHLCNTRPKRRLQPCDSAVFTLCVQTSSLRLDTRRRGASPGRPVQALKFTSP